MTNKEYKIARENAESASELYEFEHYNGWYVSRGMTAEDVKKMRAERKAEKKNGAYTLDGFNDRAIVKPYGYGETLTSYNTTVCAMVCGDFVKTWDGYSATTMKHVNTFREIYGLPKLSKREWIEMDTIAEVVSPLTGEIAFPPMA